MVVDALLGVGIHGQVEGLLDKVIRDVNFWQKTPAGKCVIAVDIPSGLPADGPLAGDIAIHADVTVTFTAPKLGLLCSPNREYVGRLVVRQIGTPLELIADSPLRWTEPAEFAGLPLARQRDSHKGDYGHVLVVAGSRGKSGAAALAGLSALHAGAGLVTVATPESSLAIVAGHAPELMTEPLPETDTGTISLRSLDYARLEKLQQGKSVLVVGPGLGTHPETQELIRTLVGTTKLPVILDADGLNAFVGRAAELASRQTKHLVVTPHPGEMARLLACSTQDVQSRRIEVAREAAAKWKCAVILKGAGTVVSCDGSHCFINTTGNPWMATGGSGDVLSGLLAGYVAQFGTENWESSLSFAVYCHGRAGDLELAKYGPGPVLPTALFAHLRSVRQEIQDCVAGHSDAKTLA